MTFNQVAYTAKWYTVWTGHKLHRYQISIICTVEWRWVLSQNTKKLK